MQDRKQVVITGIGAITPIGSGRKGLWQGVLAGRSAVQRIDRFDPTPFRSQVAAQVNDFDPLDHLEAPRARRLDRYSQFAIAAAQQAVLDSVSASRKGTRRSQGSIWAVPLAVCPSPKSSTSNIWTRAYVRSTIYLPSRFSARLLRAT